MTPSSGMKEEILYTATSTVGACWCGGLISFTSCRKTFKRLFEIGKFVVLKQDKTLYQCQKCKEWQ